MVSNETRQEIEQFLGQVPSWIEALSEPAADHGWGIVRDLEFGETELSDREKALAGLGAAAAIQCPYCIHFHRADAEMAGVGESEMAEAVDLAGTVRYFSTALHGAEVGYDEFVEETSELVEYIEEQQAAADD